MTYASERAASLDTFDAFAHFDHESEQIGWMELGYAALGYTSVARKAAGGLHTEYVWVQRQQEQVEGLPAPIVNRARAAIAAEQSALQALQEATKQATEDIGRLGLSGSAAEYHLQLKRGESWAQHQACQRPVRLACRDLGRLAEAAERIRAVRNAYPGKRAQIEQQAQILLAQADAELQAVELESAQLGLSS